MGKQFGNKTAEVNRPEEKKNDNYATHYSLTELFLKHHPLDSDATVLEPSAGEGCMTKVLKDKFQEVISIDPKYGFERYYKKELQIEPVDKYPNYSFLKTDLKDVAESIDYIITNPPNSKIDQFINMAKKYNPQEICFLMPINTLSGYTRFKNKTLYGLKYVYTFNRMPDFRAPIRDDGKFPTAMKVYAWFVFVRGYNGHKGEYIGKYIDCQKYAISTKEMEPEYKQKLIDLGILKEKGKKKCQAKL